MSRFDYVKYDDKAIAKQAKLKAAAQKVEAAINALDEAIRKMDGEMQRELSNEQGFLSPNGELARCRLYDVFGPDRDAGDMLIAIEESYMWTGKDIRDNQIERNGSAPMQDERTNS